MSFIKKNGHSTSPVPALYATDEAKQVENCHKIFEK
jgi:hypothetical protein